MKRAALFTALMLSLSACAVTDSAGLNAESANEYRGMVAAAAKKGQVDTQSATAKRVHAIFRRLVPHADAANRTGHPFQWEMTVFRDDELNAWAMPGGKMAVYTGIVEQLKLNDDEIAAIIGHEMTHALLEHTKKESNRNFGIGLAAQIGSGILQATTGVDGNLIDTGLGLAVDLGLDKPFSRDAEREADIGGMRLMAQAGYNPEAAVTVWQKMNRLSNNNNVFTKILSTHPTNNDRIKNLQKELPKVMPLYRQSIGAK
ncbi:M48 family metallopeptidase [Conchiformibius steedae]|uniref:M48 family metallopeptidase n=1 Tax=Conchiformibius steedae TaxID=153493 RepID=UPI0026EE8539|nr:M48 family metallopeptidase [Conchiformibius steedae]